MLELAKQRQPEYGDSLIELFPEEYNGTGKKNRNFTFQVTDDCCMACTYCYQINKGTHKLTFESAKKMVDKILDLENPLEYLNPAKTNSMVFEFIGGEPFMEIELITQICDYIEEQMIIKEHPWLFRHRFSICSNGLLYFKPEVQSFMRKYQGLLSFSISIDGNKQLHDACRVDLQGNGTYDRAIAAVKHYVENYQSTMGSKMTLSPDNIMYAKEAVLGLIESGYNVIHLNCVYEKGWTIEHARILYQQLKELADYILENRLCESHYISMFNSENFHPMDPVNDNENWCGGVNSSMLSMDYKGDLYPCIRYMESSLGEDQEPVIIGNVDRGLFTTEKELEFQKELNDVTRRNQSTDECFYCPIAQGCAWCSAYNYQEFGTVRKRATYICEMHQATALANAYYWNKAFKLYDDPKRFKLWIPKEWALKIIDEDEWNMLRSLSYMK